MWKTEWAPIFNFRVVKWGSQAGVHPISTPSGSRRVPLLSSPHFPTWKLKIGAHSVFHTVFRNCYWKKVKQRTITWSSEHIVACRKTHSLSLSICEIFSLLSNCVCQNLISLKIDHFWYLMEKRWYTLHLEWKSLVTNSPEKLQHVLDTINPNWFCPWSPFCCTSSLSP